MGTVTNVFTRVEHNGQTHYGCNPFYTDTIKGYFSIIKRGLKGVCQQFTKKPLHRFLAEFDFCHNEGNITNIEQSDMVLGGIIGNRLTYRGSQWASR